MGDEGDAQLADELTSASAAHRRQYQPGRGRRGIQLPLSKISGEG
jgi:hypothetical protein